MHRGHPARVHQELEYKGITTVERRLDYAGDPARVAGARGDPWLEPGAQRRHVVCSQKLQMPLPLGRLQTVESGKEAIDFRQHEPPLAKGRVVPGPVLKVPLDSHGAEDEPAKVDVRCLGDDLVLQRSAAG